MFKRLETRIVGASPLIVHNGQLADPSNSFAKEMAKVRSKRGKTDSDLEELAHLEFLGSLYLDGGKPCIPGEVIEATLLTAAKKLKRGKQCGAGLIAENATLIYDGPTEPEKLWEDENFRLRAMVRVQLARTPRVRPIFKKWNATLALDYDDSLLNESEVQQIIKVAGEQVGLCDWRPKFGRFSIAE